jgi:predicted nucleic acid-binding protein
VRTAVDSNVVSAVFRTEATSARLISLLGELGSAGSLVVCGVVFAEVHAVPGMSDSLLRDFLSDTGIAVEMTTSRDEWKLTGERFGEYAIRRRKSGDGHPKRLLADFAVGAHAALLCDQLLTLDPSRYRTAFPRLTLVSV